MQSKSFKLRKFKKRVDNHQYRQYSFL